MNFRSIYLLFLALLKIKFNLKKIQKTPVVIYDENTFSEIRDILEIKKYYILETRFKSINLRVLITSLIFYKLKWRPKHYLYTYLSELSPSHIITSQDNDIKFWNIKNYLKNVKTIFIQNGWRDNFSDSFSQLELKDNNLFNVDKMFVFNEMYAKEYKKYISGDTHVIGSFLNNHFRISRNLNEEIIFISSFTHHPHTSVKYRMTIDYQLPTKIILPLLLRISREKKIKLKVLGRSWGRMSGSSAVEAEKNFFREFDNEIIFIPRGKERHETYKSIDDSKLVVTMDSTLGYESFAREKRVAFLTIRSQNFENKSFNFAWPYKSDDKGPFWTNSYDENYIRKIIDYLLNISEQEWKNEKKKYLDIIMPYDEDNKIFKKYISEEGLLADK
jgi:surface carbohydrate biosynthesis protein|tara:strand:+ start:109 stop:1272 length:1164 start_codon:yes stop_codon:yes gene_type:complete